MAHVIPNQREEFDIPEDTAYFNCGYMGPLSNTVREAGHSGIDAKRHPWRISQQDFFTDSNTLRRLFAQLIDASADDIAIVPAASYGIATAARNIPLARGQSIVLMEEQFPSNVYSWRELAQESGGIIKTAIRRDGFDLTNPVLEAIDERTAIVACAHNHWADGALLDLVAIGQKCRQMGAALVLDMTQSIGALPFSVKDVQPDFMVTAFYKWMLGPHSFGTLYVAPKWQQGAPLEHNWIGREGSHDFAALVNYKDGFQTGAHRFDMGERSTFHLMPMAIAAVEQILGWGVDNISHTLGAYNDTLARACEGLGLIALPRNSSAPHFLGLRFPSGAPEDLVATLAQQKLFVSLRGDSMRVTPHLYNNLQDMDRLLAALPRI